MEYITPLINLTCQMAPYLLFGFLIAGILHSFVPRRLYNRHLAANNLRSVVLAALFGVPLPLCSCGVIPTAMSLRKSGASKGATVSFLISTPQTGVDSILATGSLLGAPFAILRPIIALLTAIFGGVLVNRFTEQTTIPTSDDETASTASTFVERCRKALHYGFVEMMQDIGKWLIIGLLIAAAITILVPDNLLTALSEYPLLNMLLVLLFATPMYLCATGSIPIAAALMLKGLSPGAALVLLMAGPATNMAAILVINKVLGRKTLILYLTSIIVGAVGFGLFIDYLLPAEWFARGIIEATTAHHTTLPWWEVLSGILLALLLAYALLTKFRNGNHAGEGRVFRVQGMRCNHCKANVERNLTQLNGIRSAYVELAEGTVYVEGSASDEEVVATIEKLGFTVEK